MSLNQESKSELTVPPRRLGGIFSLIKGNRKEERHMKPREESGEQLNYFPNKESDVGKQSLWGKGVGFPQRLSGQSSLGGH